MNYKVQQGKECMQKRNPLTDEKSIVDKDQERKQ